MEDELKEILANIKTRKDQLLFTLKLSIVWYESGKLTTEEMLSSTLEFCNQLAKEATKQ
jgi:hypothetical protein